MDNRRDFFKAIGLFAAGVVGAKIASYTPKKKQEELQVAESVTVRDGKGNEYNMVVVPKKVEPKPVTIHNANTTHSNERFRITADGQLTTSGSATYGGIITCNAEPGLIVTQSKKLRKLNS